MKIYFVFFALLLMSGCMTTDQLRTHVDFTIGEKPRMNAIIVLDKKSGERDVDSS